MIGVCYTTRDTEKRASKHYYYNIYYYKIYKTETEPTVCVAVSRLPRNGSGRFDLRDREPL